MNEVDSGPELDADALAVIASYRRAESIPDDLEDRVWAQLSATPEPEAQASDTHEGQGERTRWGVVLLVAAAAIGVLAIGLRAVSPDETFQDRNGAQAPYQGKAEGASGAAQRVDHEAAAPKRTTTWESTPQVEPALGLEPETVVLPEPEPAPVAQPKPRRPPKPSAQAPANDSPATLSEETRLLRDARAAMQARAPGRALAILADSKKRFPSGLLLEERQALEVLALCAAGKTKAGRAKASVFLSKRPRSALAPRVRGACKSADAP